MKLTRHNGRAGKNGVYNPKHNDRSFDIANSEHIDEERAKQNLYWDCYNGFRNFKNPDKENELSATFEDVEQLFYRQRYRDFVTGQNERNVKNRHPERNKETGDLLKRKRPVQRKRSIRLEHLIIMFHRNCSLRLSQNLWKS